jgi:hypothetical protein
VKISPVPVRGEQAAMPVHGHHDLINLSNEPYPPARIRGIDPDLQR